MAHMTFTLVDKDGMTSSTFILKDEDVIRIHIALCSVYKSEDVSYDGIFSTLFTNLMTSVLNSVHNQESEELYRQARDTVRPIPLEKQ